VFIGIYAAIISMYGRQEILPVVADIFQRTQLKGSLEASTT
jgi:hypothetical protein